MSSAARGNQKRGRDGPGHGLGKDRCLNIAAAASDVSAVGSLSRHRLREFVLANHVEQLTAAIDEDVVVGLLEKVVDILFPPKVSDDLRAVEDIAKTEHPSGRRHLFAYDANSPNQFAFHPR